MDLKKERLIERWIGKNVVLDKWEKVWKISRYHPLIDIMLRNVNQ